MSEAFGPALDFRLYEVTPGVSVIVRPNAPVFTLVAASNDFVAFTGLKRENFIGKGHFHFFTLQQNHPQVTEEQNLRASFEYAIENKKAHEIPVQRFDLQGNDGTLLVKYWRIKNTPLLDEFGAVAFIIHTIFDITDAVIGDGAFEAVGIQQAHKLFMNAPVLIGYVRGDDYIIDFANEGLLKVWGKTRDIIGKPLLKVFPELEVQGTKQLLDEVRRTGKPFFAYEHPLQFNRDGKVETAYFDFVYQPYYENGHEEMATGVISVGHDVTEQIRARQLERSLEELKYANQNLEEFAYAASHDLKEPVRKILYFVSRLKEELKEKLEQNQIDLFDRLDKSSMRMQNLIDDLLEYSYTAKDSSEQEEIDLGAKVKLVLEDLELEIQKKQAKIDCDSLPTIRGNKRQMQQLFQNLLSNALKYNRPGVTPLITITCSVADASEVTKRLPLEAGNKVFYLIAIADNGIGFDQRDADRIFNVFTRLHSGSQYTGTGIGLSIVRKVIESHHGSIWAESEAGKGSTFSLLLPA
jgi:hypothetical protein